MTSPNTTLDERQARDILRRSGSPAADPARYSARAYPDGWCFDRIDDGSPVPMGATSWLVTHTGRIALPRFGESMEAALRRAMHSEPSKDRR